MPEIKYSLPEIERRWLVDPGSPQLDLPAHFSLIEDIYIAGTRLRLRKITLPDASVQFKLCKKYPDKSGPMQSITNIYLAAEEFTLFVGLEGCQLKKKRFSVFGGSLDVFDFENLVIFEKEFRSAEAATAYNPPEIVGREITTENYWSGFEIARRRLSLR